MSTDLIDPPKKLRRKSTERSPRPIKLTDSDADIIRHVAKHRFLRSPDIARLTGRPLDKVRERANELYHSAHLDRPRIQFDLPFEKGSAPHIFALGNKGADLLSALDGVPRAKVDWTEKNYTVGAVFFLHTLMIADLMIGFELAARATLGAIRLMEPNEILSRAPETTRRAANPWKFTATIVDATGRVEVGNIPDKVFGLDNTQARKRSYFLYEADRGTMPITRTHPRQTSFQQKVLGYLAGGGSENAHGKRFGIGNFRVLTVTTSPQRVETMIAAVKAATGGTGSRQFLFGVHSEISASPNLLQHEWITGTGDRVRLLE
jgi:hypothetical protein